jgi:hypothetical protein
VALGIPVHLVDVRGDAARRGFTQCEYPGDRSYAFKRMIVILCGPIMGAKSFDEVPSWPLNPTRSTDERNLYELSEYLGLDERGYRRVVRDALNLSCTPTFNQLFVAITGMLDYVPQIDSDLLEEVIEIRERR